MKGIRESLLKINNPKAGQNRSRCLAELRAAILGERQLLSNLDEARAAGAHAVCLEITRLNRRQPLDVVLKVHKNVLVSSNCSFQLCINVLAISCVPLSQTLCQLLFGS